MDRVRLYRHEGVTYHFAVFYVIIISNIEKINLDTSVEYTGNKSNVKTLLVETNKSCNLKCDYCFYNDYGRNNSEISLENIDEIISDFDNLEMIYLTGGEVTLLRDFTNVVDRLFQENIKVGVFSNGTVLDSYSFNELEEVYSKIQKLFISYDSFDPDYLYRQNQELALSAIKKIVNINPDKLIVKIGVNRISLDNFNETVAFLEKMGVNHLSVNLIHNINSSSEDFELNRQEMESLFNSIHQKGYLFDQKYISKLEDFFLYIDNSKLDCPAGKSFGFIDGDNRFMPCPADYQKADCLSKECICLWEMFDDK